MTYNMYKDVKEEGDIMNNYEKIKSLLEKNNGILYVKELEKNKIPKNIRRKRRSHKSNQRLICSTR